ncbi:hypothetical protein [Natranaerofaba carboxydovora]|uniref:hypothetical protein n=1 Tax=Natranaerofaba carboxydovora TaxID=2742683 RepID=UPI001F13AE42|nr:hypothetical protein [Natranaerofaba carboxydovora]UMZ73009.1 hypothetical protein ACONDI_00553 [Natranaerofaba carboxydovora]
MDNNKRQKGYWGNKVIECLKKCTSPEKPYSIEGLQNKISEFDPAGKRPQTKNYTAPY